MNLLPAPADDGTGAQVNSLIGELLTLTSSWQRLARLLQGAVQSGSVTPEMGEHLRLEFWETANRILSTFALLRALTNTSTHSYWIFTSNKARYNRIVNTQAVAHCALYHNSLTIILEHS